MTDARMLIIVPTRSRPENVAKVVCAWEETDAFRHADLCFAIDMDDPKIDVYNHALWGADAPAYKMWPARLPEWKPMVHKLNEVALNHAVMGAPTGVKASPLTNYFAIGFAGDDHLPRTRGWAARYLEKLIEMGTGVVSCPDGFRQDELPTQWAMTTDIVRALGRMVPAPVEHLYCDNAVWDLAEAAGCYAYLEDVLIEHMHPLANRTGWDDQYRNVNSEAQYERDSEAYEAWKSGERGVHSLIEDEEIVRGLIEKRASSTAPNSSGDVSC